MRETLSRMFGFNIMNLSTRTQFLTTLRLKFNPTNMMTKLSFLEYFEGEYHD